MAKRVIFSKIYSDGIERTTEKDCNTETEMRKCFDECVVSFEEFCKKFARFVNEGNVIGFQDLFQKAQRDIGQNANAKIVFFDITMQVAVLLHTT